MKPMSEIASQTSAPSSAARGPQAREAALRAAPIRDWLIDEERLRRFRTPLLLDRYARRLVEAGLPLHRVSLHIPQLHPQLAARSLVWDADSGGAVEAAHEHSARHLPTYVASPVKPIFEGGPPIRRHLESADCAKDFPIVQELAAQGFTDYTIRPLLFSDRRPNAISLATRRPGGFAEIDLAVLDQTLPAFASVLELRQLQRTAQEVLSTYVGPNTGERILSGAIRRGDGEMIHAVLWYCDLRGFTALADTQPLDDVIALLNAYFDCVATPVVERGGEILKFIGDAMLAIFPCEDREAATCDAADRALQAALAAAEAVAKLRLSCAEEGKTGLTCGVALHIGDVMYGNVGADARLDFTVIGPAVNLVSRIEPLCGSLNVPLVISAQLAGALPGPLRSLGRHALKGIAEPQEIFTPASAPGAASKPVAL